MNGSLTGGETDMNHDEAVEDSTLNIFKNAVAGKLERVAGAE